MTNATDTWKQYGHLWPSDDLIGIWIGVVATLALVWVLL